MTGPVMPTIEPPPPGAVPVATTSAKWERIVAPNDGRVQQRMERTLGAITPHDRLDNPHAPRSFPSFGG